MINILTRPQNYYSIPCFECLRTQDNVRNTAEVSPAATTTCSAGKTCQRSFGPICLPRSQVYQCNPASALVIAEFQVCISKLYTLSYRAPTLELSVSTLEIG